MSFSLMLACLWGLSANLIAMLPSKDNHWTAAYILMGFGAPILGFVVYQHGPWFGAAVLVMAMSLLRWPVIYLWRWMQRQF